jgi:hypothetical protein
LRSARIGRAATRRISRENIVFERRFSSFRDLEKYSDFRVDDFAIRVE